MNKNEAADVHRQRYQEGYVYCQLCGTALLIGVHICLMSAGNAATYGSSADCANVCDNCALNIGKATKEEPHD